MHRIDWWPSCSVCPHFKPRSENCCWRKTNNFLSLKNPQSKNTWSSVIGKFRWNFTWTTINFWRKSWAWSAFWLKKYKSNQTMEKRRSLYDERKWRYHSYDLESNKGPKIRQIGPKTWKSYWMGRFLGRKIHTLENSKQLYIERYSKWRLWDIWKTRCDENSFLGWVWVSLIIKNLLPYLFAIMIPKLPKMNIFHVFCVYR